MEVMLWIFIPLKNPLSSARFEPMTLALLDQSPVCRPRTLPLSATRMLGIGFSSEIFCFNLI